jgi:hypothetical protein
MFLAGKKCLAAFLISFGELLSRFLSRRSDNIYDIYHFFDKKCKGKMCEKKKKKGFESKGF